MTIYFQAQHLEVLLKCFLCKTVQFRMQVLIPRTNSQHRCPNPIFVQGRRVSDSRILITRILLRQHRSSFRLLSIKKSLYSDAGLSVLFPGMLADSDQLAHETLSPPCARIFENVLL
jgi:hypothetical protein